MKVSLTIANTWCHLCQGGSTSRPFQGANKSLMLRGCAPAVSRLPCVPRSSLCCVGFFSLPLLFNRHCCRLVVIYMANVCIMFRSVTVSRSVTRSPLALFRRIILVVLFSYAVSQARLVSHTHSRGLISAKSCTFFAVLLAGTRAFFLRMYVYDYYVLSLSLLPHLLSSFLDLGAFLCRSVAVQCFPLYLLS